MTISKLIKKLTAIKDERGDLVCTAWQHEEEEERSAEVSSLYVSEEEDFSWKSGEFRKTGRTLLHIS